MRLDLTHEPRMQIDLLCKPIGWFLYDDNIDG